MATDVVSGPLSWRDIYRAVGDSETRIKEHIDAVLQPMALQLADHEVRLRAREAADASRTARGETILGMLGASRAFLLLLLAAVSASGAITVFLGK